MVVSFLVVNGRACGAADGWFLAAPVGLAFDDQLVCGGGEPAGGGLREQGVSHHGQPFLGGAVRGDHGRGPLVPFDAQLVEVTGFGGIQRLEREVIKDQQLDAGEAAHLGVQAVAEPGGLEPLEQLRGAGHVHGAPAADGDVAERAGQVCFSGADRDGDRLQHLRAVLPCEVRVTSAAHPLGGRLVAARSFKRLNGVLLLVIELPDGSPGTIPAAATDVLGSGEADGPAVVLDAVGWRELRALVSALAGGKGRGR